jgi:hypothetical protein
MALSTPSFKGSGFKGSAFKVQKFLGFRFQVSGVREKGSGFRAQGSGLIRFQVSGVRCQLVSGFWPLATGQMRMTV